MNFAINIIIVFSLIWFWRDRRKKLLLFNYKSDLKMLRYELHWLGIDGQLNTDSWIYEFLDNSIKLASTYMINYNFYEEMILDLLHPKEKKSAAVKLLYDPELSVEENQRFQEFHKKLSKLNFNYITKKHDVLNLITLIHRKLA